MERATPVGSAQGDMAVQFRCCYMPKPSEASVYIASYPASNCNKYWGLIGDFWATLRLYQQGKLKLKLHTSRQNETGTIVFELEKYRSFLEDSLEGVIVVEYWHTSSIPMELYASYTYREAGDYVALPISTYLGDTIFVDNHANLMENAVFWPGLVGPQNSENLLLLPNPYSQKIQYEVWLYLPDGSRVKSDILKTRAYSVNVWEVGKLFENQIGSLRDPLLTCSLCVSSQYKVVAYFAIRNKKYGVLTTVDHLHPYGLV